MRLEWDKKIAVPLEMAMLLGHPISFDKHIRSLFYFHDTITVALRRYKTAILSKQSTFLGLYQGAAAAGAENDLRLCARRRRIKKRKKEKERETREGKRKDSHRLYIRKFSEYFVAFFSPSSPSTPCYSLSRYFCICQIATWHIFIFPSRLHERGERFFCFSHSEILLDRRLRIFG